MLVEDCEKHPEIERAVPVNLTPEIDMPIISRHDVADFHRCSAHPRKIIGFAWNPCDFTDVGEHNAVPIDDTSRKIDKEVKASIAVTVCDPETHGMVSFLYVN